MMMSFATTVPIGIAVGLLLFTGPYEGGLYFLYPFSHPPYLTYFNSQDETDTRCYGSCLGGHAHLRGLS